MRGVVCAIVWMCLLHASVALADPAGTSAASAESTGQYKVHIQRALREFELGHWSEARAFFVRAHQLLPNARTLRGLGLASYEMRDYVAAIQYLRQALVHEQQPLTEAMRAEVTRQIEEADSFISHCKLSVEPSEASVKVDGELASRGADGTLMINTGEHEITIEAAGFEPATRTLTVNGGERPELRFVLRRTTPVAPAVSEQVAVPSPSTTPSDQGSSPDFFALTPVKIVGLAVTAGAVVAAGIGAAFSIAALNEKAASGRECDAYGCSPAGLAYREKALARADGATVSFATAGTLLVAGVLTFVLAPAPVNERARASVAFEPRFAVGSAEATVKGAF